MPDRLALKGFAGTAPLGGAWFDLHFPTSRNPVSFVVGPADGSGELHLTEANLEARYSQAIQTGVMDHGAWSGEVFVGVVDLAGLARLRDAYTTWKSFEGLFPPDYAERLDVLEQTLFEVEGETLRAVVGAEPPTQVNALSPRLNQSNNSSR